MVIAGGVASSRSECLPRGRRKVTITVYSRRKWETFSDSSFLRIAYLQGERQPLLGPNDADAKFGSGGVTNVKSVFWCKPLFETVFRKASDRALPQNPHSKMIFIRCLINVIF